jgi:hypothetical protein
MTQASNPKIVFLVISSLVSYLNRPFVLSMFHSLLELYFFPLMVSFKCIGYTESNGRNIFSDEVEVVWKGEVQI